MKDIVDYIFGNSLYNASLMDNLYKKVDPYWTEQNMFRWLDSKVSEWHLKAYLEMKDISLPLGYVCSLDISNTLDAVEAKNTFQRIQNLYEDYPFEEWAGFIKKGGLLGKAYYNALLDTSGGNPERMGIPTAQEIFGQLKKLLWRLHYNGVTISEDVREAFM
jgi:hypothetical protein